MARYPKAIWKGANANNFSMNKITPKFIVVHVMEGTLTGTDGWFQNPHAIVSAHFGVGKNGEVHQYVDTSECAYAEVDWNNRAISIEHEGKTGEHLTAAQAQASHDLIKWISQTHAIRAVRTSNPNDPNGGVIGHGELGVDGGNHPLCPGAPILADVTAFLAPSPAPTPAPPKSPSSPLSGPSEVRPTIGLGSVGTNVRYLQRKLKLLETGFYGLRTASAVKRFQFVHGLAVDGICGPQTWAKVG